MPRPVELFLGGLSKDTRRADLEDIFSKYGRMTRCDIKYVNGYAGTAYGFVGYEDDRDAEVNTLFVLFFADLQSNLLALIVNPD
jgi:hypothetical protein